MSLMLSIWMAVALLALCGGQNAEHEGNSLSPSGYHLCVHNETRIVSFLAMHRVPYTVTKPCGGWLLWKTCTVTIYKMIHQTEYKMVMEQVTRCCEGYVQVGHYCALPVNRSGEFTAKPGSCPTADGLYPESEDCELDMDCPGWEKCCQRLGLSRCSNPESSANYSDNGGYRLNATVTVKAEYQQLMSEDGGHLHHTRLLQAMVTGALQSEVSIFFLSSWPVHPYRTATSLLIESNVTLSLHNVTSKLHLLLKNIQEVSSVTVEDVNECAQSPLCQCSPLANCYNTVGSYHCACRQGYIDVDPRNPGAHCTAPPSITILRSVNVTGTSFSVYWSSQSQINQTYQVVLSKGSEVIHSWTLSQTTKDIPGLQPGVLYNVTVTPQACGGQGAALSIFVKTNAQTFDATARLTNIEFTADLQNTSSQAYKNLSESIIDEIYQSLSPEMRAMVDSGQVRIEITSFSAGSVVVNFTIIFTPSQSQDISNVSTALLHSLLNSTKYTVDGNNTSINDANECATGENDCSEWATCTNTRGSYTCDCLDGFTDSDSGRPGRACQAIPTSETTTTMVSTTVPPTTLVSHSSADTTTASTTTTTTAPTTAHNNNHSCPNNHNNCPNNTQLPQQPQLHQQPLTTAANNTATTTHCPNNNHNCQLLQQPPLLPQQLSLLHQQPLPLPPQQPLLLPQQLLPHTLLLPQQPLLLPQQLLPQQPLHHYYCPNNYCPNNHYNHYYCPNNHHYCPNNHHYCPNNHHYYCPNNHHYCPNNHHYCPNNHHYCPSNYHYCPINNHRYCPQRGGTSPSMQRSISVECRVAAITVTVDKAFLQAANIRESALYLGSVECGVNGGNSSHVQLTVAWNECVTRIVHNETYYTASVTLYNSMDTSPTGTVEIPSIRLEVPIMCTYLRSMLISSDFGSMGYDMIQDVVMGSGSFQVTVQLMNGALPLPHNYSLSPEEAVVVEVSLNTSSDQIKMVISKCWATPTPNPSNTESYVFLEHSCSLNTYTKVLMNGNSSTSRVSVQIFAFVNLYMLYLHCQVQICVEIGSATCVPDCLQRTSRSSNTIGTAMGSSGPLLRSDEESLKEYDLLHIVGFSCLGIGLLLCFIVGFVCVFYYQRNRIGHYNFSVKTKQENFTYLVFNA
ncbi:hypothetical protein L3Q82_022024 [Scortum barcoo]|uniref:Uncharacterized protein n=1 Tax=Scortum barcoo TaxID=214431 RepID=A0ACB8X0X3_9TELE|nr:hypothetical protein L3Q82_022024 [Scortum barcoo]